MATQTAFRTEGETINDEVEDHPVVDSFVWDHEHNHIPFGLLVPECPLCSDECDNEYWW